MFTANYTAFVEDEKVYVYIVLDSTDSTRDTWKGEGEKR